MKANYHTHTYRCGHALGNEKDMIEGAIRAGIEVLGFSDHIPYPVYYPWQGYTPAQSEISKKISENPGMRMPYEMMYLHLEEVKQCKEKYSQMTIYQGFEAEYFPLYQDYYQELLNLKKVDYLILGQHYYIDENRLNYYGREHLTDREVIQYGEDVCRALDTHLFSYVAHPDLFMQGLYHFTQACQETSIKICQKAKSLDIPLEINAGRLNYPKRNVDGIMTYVYPNDHFWNIARAIGNRVILGLDAHRPDAFNEKDMMLLERFAKRFKLSTTEEIVFKKGQK